MRKKQEILKKARELLEDAREDFVDKRTCKHFRNCEFNETLVPRSIGKINYCRLNSKVGDDNKIDKLFICDSDEWVCECEKFSCRNTKESVEKDFVEIISNPSRCSQLFPRLSTLLWVLNDGKHREAKLSDDCHKNSTHGHEKNEKKEEMSFLGNIIRRVKGGE